MPLRDPIDPTTLHSTGRRARFGMRNPKQNMLGAFENAETMKWASDTHNRKWGLKETPANLQEINLKSAGARVVRVFERDGKTGRQGKPLEGVHSVSIAGKEVPVVDGEIVILDSGLGNEILQKSRDEAKALDDFIATCLSGGSDYIYWSHPKMYAEMKEARCLPSDLAAMVPSSQDTADKVWLFGRIARRFLNTVVWSGKRPNVGSTHESKSSKQPPHREVSEGRPVVAGGV